MTQTILYLNNTDPEDGGGGDRRLFDEATVIADSGADVRIIASRTDPTLPAKREVDGVSIRTIKCVPDALSRFTTLYFYLSRSLFPFVSFPLLLWIMWTDEIDVIVDSYTPHPTLVAPVARVFSIPVVALVHEFHDRSALSKYPLPIGVIQLLVQNLLRSGLYSAVVVPRELTKQELHEYGVTTQIHVVPNGINYESYCTSPDDVDAKQYDLLVVSRLVHRKGIDLLLEAMENVVDERPETTLAIAGTGPRQQALERQAEKSGISENVDFLGFVSEQRKIGLLHEARIFVLPSRQEGFGIAVLEAMATETPVVVNDLRILRALVPDDESCFVDATDAEVFADTLVTLLDQPDASLQELGTKNQNRAVDFTLQQVGKTAKQVYSVVDD
ncbi:glycosyltransferase family 4 protein [Haladaptatus sp. AB618]|uniref:glycosyltransferase family 4 protein n=1 Tax=Haladaptatus sp. AB618 TaxID=2934173 RepID=UPI00209C08BD|nr:glycosyltransferase family 4 protein [Haladaptatus sp. AB618]MCO8255724.1 glycosyltransferase family 4 protein [Haladaptatus sp. AB618]